MCVRALAPEPSIIGWVARFVGPGAHAAQGERDVHERTEQIRRASDQRSAPGTKQQIRRPAACKRHPRMPCAWMRGPLACHRFSHVSPAAPDDERVSTSRQCSEQMNRWGSGGRGWTVKRSRAGKLHRRRLRCALCCSAGRLGCCCGCCWRRRGRGAAVPPAASKMRMPRIICIARGRQRHEAACACAPQPRRRPQLKRLGKRVGQRGRRRLSQCLVCSSELLHCCLGLAGALRRRPRPAARWHRLVGDGRQCVGAPCA